MVDYLKQLQTNIKEIKTKTNTYRNNLATYLNNLGVSSASNSMDLEKLVSLIGFVGYSGKMPTTLTLTSDKSIVTSGESVELTATLTDVNGNPIPEEEVSILDSDGNVLYTGITDKNGKITTKQSILHTQNYKAEYIALNKITINSSSLTITIKYGTYYTADISNYNKVNIGGSSGNYSYTSNNGSYTATCNGWSRVVRLDIANESYKGSSFEVTFKHTTNEVSGLSILSSDGSMCGVSCSFLDVSQTNPQFGYSTGLGDYFKGQYITYNTIQYTGDYYKIKLDVNEKGSLSAYLYDETGKLLSSLINLQTISEDFTYGIILSYCGTSDGKGYYHEWKNMLRLT